MNELGVLVWYLDDGFYNPWTRVLYFSTNSFTDDEHRILIEWFKERFDIEPKMLKKKQSLSGKIQNILYFPRAETDKLLNVLYPVFREYHLPPDCLIYKMGHFAPENRELLESKRRQRHAYRAVSVYIRPEVYDGLLQLCKDHKEREIMGLLHGTFPRRDITRFEMIDTDGSPTGTYVKPYPTKSRNYGPEEDPKDTVLGWFHSHVKDYDTPSRPDIDTHLVMFNGRPRYIMAIVNVPANMGRFYDHVKDDGTYRICQPVLTENYHRMALPYNEVIIQHLKDGLKVPEIAERYGVSPEAVYILLRRAGIPTKFPEVL
jgi:proteasome lid subunit RPN8/RPN11